MTARAPEDVDRQLLALLREDARRNVSELALALGVSRSTIYSSIERLERAGTILGYTVRLGDAYDRRLIRAHVMIKVLPKAIGVTQDALATMSELAGLYAIAGEYDLIAIVEAPDLTRLNDLLDAIGAIEGVERTTSSVILATKLQR
ncbi:Lrp/AsnC family transcriptional regulator [Sphingosinicella sp. BN140058]|uniref:Lrp/AsnC family transcriptional regulator n=1 Tax=Sphingosinicella sp. BN140058 TaxID=1892855 RepID=UPI001011D988|nr:Lrp/AsnC family transcriptional regulator [Sphingosinicella sp. BN140058]QAY79056.1 Lrp/AsnC family transcriptional regulator [Sphingosinicella sp. BN140058]